MAIMATFFLSSLVVELTGDEAAVATVKRMIVYGLFGLVPALMFTGLSGRALTGPRKGRLIKTKMQRMMFVALNGLFVLLPCAIVLNNLAASGRFETTFYVLQSIELAAGAVNLGLMGLNFRDGLRLTGRWRKKNRLAAPQQN
jgi:hypothetical protein